MPIYPTRPNGVVPRVLDAVQRQGVPRFASAAERTAQYPNPAVDALSIVNGTVERWSGTAWVVVTSGGGGSTVDVLNDLSDVNTAVGTVDGAVLTYDQASGQWYPSVDLDTIDDLLDVDTATIPPTNGQVLAWDDVVGQWRPVTVTEEGTTLAPEVISTDGSGVGRLYYGPYDPDPTSFASLWLVTRVPVDDPTPPSNPVTAAPVVTVT